jgi:hypothetical protein
MYRLFATRPAPAITVGTFIWNGRLLPGTGINSGNNTFTIPANKATVSGGSSMVAEENAGNRIELNFHDGDRLLFSRDPNIGSPIRVTFEQPVRRAGAQISASAGFGTREFDFLAVIIIATARGNKRFEKLCTSLAERDDSASFVGVKCDATDDPILSIDFDVKKRPRARKTIVRYGINQLTVART